MLLNRKELQIKLNNSSTFFSHAHRGLSDWESCNMIKLMR